MRLFVCLITIISVSILKATIYYVSPDGSDDNSGTIGAPFQTIQYAVDQMQFSDSCYLRAGIYHEEIQINNLNGNSSDPITFTNYQDESVILDGTIPITSAWTVHDGNIYKTTLTEDIWQLFVDGEEMVMARWPNARFDDETIWDQENNWAHGDPIASTNGTEIDNPYAGADLTTLGFSAEGALAILNIGSFRSYTRYVTSHFAGSNTFNYDLIPGSAYRTKHHNYFLEKKLEFMDQETEWFYDHITNELYLWAPDNTDPNSLNITGKVQAYAMQIENSSFLEISGLQFFGTTFKIDNSNDIHIDSCHFLYPSCYQRMLGIAGVEPEMTLLSGSDNCVISHCSFQYTDGSVIETFNGDNRIEDCYFYHIDYTVTDLSSVMTTIRMGGSNNVFRRNTLHRTGASSGINPGNLSIVEYNDMYDTGYLQSDGAIVHLMVGQQPGSETRYNWLHDSPKYGIRFDGEGDGNNGLIHHNVIWNVRGGIMIKGYEHMIYNNTAFDNGDKNDIIIMIAQGGNEGTTTRNNAANKIAGHRSDTYQNYPVPGIYDHNWNGYETSGDVKDFLISPPSYENFEEYNPDEYDFRPRPDSVLIDAGIHVEGITDSYVGNAPDLGAYEYGGENWKPGVTWDVSSYQLGFDEQRNTETLPKEFQLQQNYPNPFNSSTQIRFSLKLRQQIRLSIYSITGQLVYTILNKFMVDGHHIIEWNPVGISTGIYFIRLESENGTQVKKCLLLK
ncbi:MAG: T9SS type A sorting domain-containing protein [Candidatus Marinimicrobia bacterium]|nr:T9SS type A sorting domain-containing protein [Candidatus Neomarinimicrobiota bacterium]